MDVQAEFLRIHMPHQHALFSYLLATERDFQKAEDLLQQATLVLWKKFGEYRRSSPYLPWALGVVRFELLHHLRDRKKSEALLPLDALEAVGAVFQEQEESLAEERRALVECVRKMSLEDQELLRARYESGASLAELSSRLRQTLAAVNMRLVRIRRALLKCTKKAILGEA